MEPLKTLNYVYPQWSIEVGWILRISSILPVPVFAIYFMSQLKGTIFQVPFSLFQNGKKFIRLKKYVDN